jgi:UDP-glucose 4-epimerase
VLVTGSEGFIGSHVVERLLVSGADVRAFCWYDPDSRQGWLDDLSPEQRALIEFRPGDIRDARDVEDAVQGCDVVLHLAALISIPHSYRVPEAFVATNISGTLNVLEACRRHGVERLVHTSTSEVYGTPDTVPITERHELRAQSPYSASKIAADKLCESYARSFDLPVTVLRPFNTYGPRQSARAVIPTIIGQLLAGITPISLGSLEPQRDFTFVADTAEAFVMAGDADLEPGTVIHLGTGTTVSVRDLVAVVGQVLGIEPVIAADDERVRPEKSEVDILLSDPAVAASALGWKATVPLEEGLAKTADWMRDRVDPERAGRYHW